MFLFLQKIFGTVIAFATSFLSYFYDVVQKAYFVKINFKIFVFWT